MQYKITIPGTFHSLNQYIDACRANAQNGARMKRHDQTIMFYYIRKQVNADELKPRLKIHYHYFEKNMKRDQDNISSYFRKVFQDALVESEVIQNDGWKWMNGFSDEFDVDPDFPRIEVVIEDGSNV